jgi:hypothetical protein
VLTGVRGGGGDGEIELVKEVAGRTELELGITLAAELPEPVQERTPVAPCPGRRSCRFRLPPQQSSEGRTRSRRFTESKPSGVIALKVPVAGSNPISVTKIFLIDLRLPPADSATKLT